MHIPMQVDYGVRALIDLAEHESEGPIRATDIAQRQGIPEPYLARVMHTLQKQGITTSQRGPLGGHVLARPPSQITMGEVMLQLGGTINLVSCLDDAGKCTQSPQCGQRSVWRDVEMAIQTVLNNTTIADLVERMKQPSEAVHNEAVRTA